MSDTAANPGSIERDLDETRSRLGTHLSQLEARLSPGQVLDDLMTYFRGSEGAAFGRNLLDSMRANPVPTALTGIGLAWLMASNPHPETDRNPSSRVRSYPGGPLTTQYSRDEYDVTLTRLREAELGVTRNPGETESAWSTRLDEARGQAMGLARQAQETAEAFSQRVRDAVSAAQRAVSEGVQGMREQVSGAVGAAGSAAGSATASARETVQGAVNYASGMASQGAQAGGSMLSTLADSPVLLGALGLAAGALLGVLIPQSEQEEALLGGVAGQARAAASGLASEGMERGQRIARTIADKAQESAQAHGLAGDKSVGEMVDAALQGELAGHAGDVAREVLQSGQEALRKEASSSAKPDPQGSATPSESRRS